MTHFIEKCKECNETINQCRCPSKLKKVRYSICKKCIDMKNEKSYRIKLYCYNCGYSTTSSKTFGERISTWYRKCIKCGCNTMKESQFVPDYQIKNSDYTIVFKK